MGRIGARTALLFALAAAALAPEALSGDARALEAPSLAGGLPPFAPAEPLRAALQSLQSGQIGLALSARDALPDGSLDRKVLTWAIALNKGRVPSTEIAAAARGLPGWPGASDMRANSERALARENHPPADVAAAFGATAPQTFEGTMALGQALLALGRAQDAQALLVPFWRERPLEAAQETAFLAAFGAALPQAAQRERLERMLYAQRVASAQRVAGASGARELCDAWSAVLRGSANAGALLERVPQAQRGAGWLFAKARLQRRAGDLDGAAQTILSAPREAAALLDPDAWWEERRTLSRLLLERGEPDLAYRLAAEHSAESAADAADAEFHAGWYALRGLHDGALAAPHFARVVAGSRAAITQARGFYWLGRAAEAGGPGSAPAFYGEAARFGTTFYGQLAAAKLKQTAVALDEPEPTAADRATFNAREAVQAIGRLEAANATATAGLLYRDLAADLTSVGEVVLLARMAEAQGNHYLALRIAKIATARGLNVGALTHPLGAIPLDADVSGAGRALAYAVARQESEFNIGAVSSAGARGLLQLLPGTAKDAARRAGLPFSAARLTADAGYNASLGSAFLADQLKRFDGSYVLTFAGYNAGPGRAREWVARFGDPRGQDLDAVVDWIERIPFAETRGYVQRVMENYQVYKMRMTGACDISKDLVTGRG